VALVGRQSPEQRFLLTMIVALFAKCPCKIHPQIGRPRIGGNRAPQQQHGLGKIALIDRVQSKRVQRLWLFSALGNDLSKKADGLVNSTGAPRLNGGGEHVLDLRLIHPLGIAPPWRLDNAAPVPHTDSKMSPPPSSTSPIPSPRSIADAVRDASWLAHRYDPDHDAVHLRHVSRDEHRKATFITDDYLPKGVEPLAVRRVDAIATAPPRAPVHFLFHSAFCCSTLLARAVDRPGWGMGLKEPVILNDIVGWRRRGGKGPDMASVLDDMLGLLARPFAPDEAVIVKPSTVVNGLAPAMLALRPDARAILLYAPLRTFLGSIAKKGIDGRLWIRTLLTGMLDDKLIDLGFTPRDHLGHTDLQVAAITWLAHQRLFAVLVDQFGRNRVRTLDSATLMQDPRAAISAIAEFFGRPLAQTAIDEIAAGPAFQTHSKSGNAFDSNDRAIEHRDAAEIHADEIDKVARWAEVVAAGAGVKLTPPAGLLS